jgi:hypothetical protein
VKALRDPSNWYHGKRKIELTFLGTRGEIKAISRRHRSHSALLVRRGRARIMIDCGTDWLKTFARVAPTAIVLTHAHDDHAAGLASGASCPVYATQETWTAIARFPIEDARVVAPRVPFKIGGVSFEAFNVEQRSERPPWVIESTKEGHPFSMSPMSPPSASPTRHFMTCLFISGTAPRSRARWCAGAIMP